MIATTGLDAEGWRLVFAVIGLGCAVAVVASWLIDKPHRPEPLAPLDLRPEETPDNDAWPEGVSVRIPGIGPDKRRLTGWERRFPLRFAWEPDDTDSWHAQALDPAPARLTPRRIPVTAPAPPSLLPPQLWPDLVGPTTQPTPAVWEVPALRDNRHVWVPAPMEQAS